MATQFQFEVTVMAMPMDPNVFRSLAVHSSELKQKTVAKQYHRLGS